MFSLFFPLLLVNASKRTSFFEDLAPNKRPRLQSSHFSKLFGSHPPIPEVLEAFKIDPMPEEDCHLRTDGDCLTWHQSKNGRVALNALLDIMPDDTSWQAELSLESISPLFFLACLTPTKLTPYIRVMIRLLDDTSVLEEQSGLFDSVKMMVGLYLAHQCQAAPRSKPYEAIARMIRLIITYHLSPSLTRLQVSESEFGDIVKYKDSLPQSIAESINEEVILALVKVKTQLLEGSYIVETLLDLIMPDPRSNRDELNLPVLLSDLPVNAWELLGDAMMRKDYLCRVFYSLFVDWRQASKTVDARDLLPRFASAMIEGPQVNVELIDQHLKMRAIHDVCLKVPHCGLDCQAAENALSFGGIMGKLRRRKVLPPITFSQSSYDLYLKELKYLHSWQRIRAIHYFTSSVKQPADAIAFPKMFSFHSPRIFTYCQSLAHAQPELLSDNTDPIFELVDASSFKSSSFTRNRVGSLMLLHLAGRLSFDALVEKLVKTTFEHKEESILGFFADHIISLLSDSDEMKGQYSSVSCLILIDTLVHLYSAYPTDCPIPKEKIGETLLMLLKFQLAAFQAEYVRPGQESIHGYLISTMGSDETLLLPALTPLHVMVYTVRRVGDGNFLIDVFNTGYEGKESDEERVAVVSYRLGWNELVDRDFLCNLLLPDQLFRQYFYPPDENVSDDMNVEQKGAQKGSTCHAKSLLFWLHRQFPLKGDRLWFKAYNFRHHANTIRTTIMNSPLNTTISLTHMSELSKSWNLGSAKPLCRPLIVSSSLYRSVMRHYSLRLAKDLREIGDYKTIQTVLMEAMSDDPEAQKCLRELIKADQN